MTETNIATTTPVAPATDTDSSLDSAERDAAPEQAEPSREERRDERVRSRLRETEAERDLYRDALAPHIRAAVEAQIASQVSEPAALWLLPDLEPLSLLGDDMSVDAEKVDAALAQLRERLPRLARRFSGSVDGGVGTPRPHRDDATWASVIKP